jgi:hypothetical protein
MMEDLAGKEGGEDFKTFWEAFGRNIKVGVDGVGVCVCGGIGLPKVWCGWYRWC